MIALKGGPYDIIQYTPSLPQALPPQISQNFPAVRVSNPLLLAHPLSGHILKIWIVPLTRQDVAAHLWQQVL